MRLSHNFYFYENALYIFKALMTKIKLLFDISKNDDVISFQIVLGYNIYNGIL